MGRRAVSWLLLGLALTSTLPAFAQEEKSQHRLEWKWRRPGVVDYVALGALAGLYAYVEFGWKQNNEPLWTNDNWFDGGIRGAVRGTSRDGRQRAAVLSDYLGLAMPVMVIFDSLVIPALDNGNWDVAWQLLVLDAEASVVTGLLTRTGNRLGRRARPDVEPCNADPEYGELCFRGPASGFPSGHTSTGFTGAGLICVHHGKLSLYGSDAADSASCLFAVTVATANGTMRLVADRHYASDVLIGSMVGLGIGLGLPYLTAYGWEEDEARDVALVPIVEPGEFGARMLGRF
jgi:membrane-associated phospholipid phosphatase